MASTINISEQSVSTIDALSLNFRIMEKKDLPIGRKDFEALVYAERP